MKWKGCEFILQLVNDCFSCHYEASSEMSRIMNSKAGTDLGGDCGSCDELDRYSPGD
jgi:hypothetical protein